MKKLSRRMIIAGSLALPFGGRDTRAAEPQGRMILLGQALLQHDLDAHQWPGMNNLATFLQGADICFSDLETAIKGANAGAALRNDEFLHAADASVLDCLTRAHINMLATSNNHAFDFGAPGIRDALNALDARGITHAGTGEDLARASAPAYRDTPHGRFALVAAASGNIQSGGGATSGTPGVNEIRRDESGDLREQDVARMLSALESAAKTADIIIAYQHNHYWEKNMGHTPPWQRDFAKRCIDAGASTFVSHGAPLLQGIEIYKGKPIFYDLGGLFFQTVTEPGHYPSEVWQSVVVDCRCSEGKINNVTLVPVQLNDTGLGGATDMMTRGTPSLAKGGMAQSILQRMAGLTAPYGVILEITGGVGRIRL